MRKRSDVQSRRYDSLAQALKFVLDRIEDEYPEIDFGIVCGARGEEAQNKAVREGKSKAPWPRSYHNTHGPGIYGSHAMDICLTKDLVDGDGEATGWMFDWNRKRNKEFSKIVRRVGQEYVKERWATDKTPKFVWGGNFTTLQGDFLHYHIDYLKFNKKHNRWLRRRG